MKITSVEAIPYAIPYTKPLRFASGEVHAAEHVLVRVHTDDGVVGVAEAPPRPFTYGETQDGVVAVIEKIFAPQVVGLTLLEREKAKPSLVEIGMKYAREVRARSNPERGLPADKAFIDSLYEDD